jgi:hypothetical protein
MIPIEGTVYTPMYEYNDKKYMRVTVNDRTRDYIHGLQDSKSKFIMNKQNVDNPLEGNVLTIKVPFRYRRVMCTVEGDTPIQSLAKGDKVKILANFSGAWNVANHSGYAWVIKEIQTPELCQLPAPPPSPGHQSPLDPLP